ncbi:MAG: sugar phosphate isomerase/epimerase [Planctomycetales bacterium]|nr:sugar phosphate isomerase/epimerase [Planctomycetales bacterium]
MAFEFCLNTSTIRPQTLLDKIRLTADAGYAGIELWVTDIYEHIGRGGEVSDIEKALSDYGLFVPCMIAVRGWAEASEFEYRHQLDECKRRFELAARLRSPYIVCSPAYEPCDTGQVTRRYRDLLQLGREAGVRPTFEYISFFKTCNSLGEAWQVVQDVDEPDATLIVDAFHSWNTNSPLELLRTIPGDRISHYHIDDAAPGIPPTQQLDPDRVMVGDGVIDLKAEIDVLRAIGYQGRVSLELFNPQLWEMDPAEVLKLGMERLTQLFS